MLKIAIEGIKLFGYHGVYAEERKKGTQFVVDVYVHTEVNASVDSDDLSHTVDYQTIYDLVCETMAKPSSLLEKLAYQIASQVLNAFSHIDGVTVKVRKIKPLLMELCDEAFVEIHLKNNFPKS
jgi:dihydroneopterin aldolase